MLRELLLRWAELEPEKCHPPDHLGSYKITAHGGAWRIGPSDIFASAPIILIRLQHCVQLAIAARPNWGFQLHLTRHIHTNEPAYFGIVDRGDGKEISSPDYSEPAIALLSAYLQALELSDGNPNRGL